MIYLPFHISREKEKDRAHTDFCRFGSFFNHIDHYPADYFLYVTSGGIAASKLATAPAAASGSKGNTKAQKDALAAVEGLSDDEANVPAGGEEEG
jgi:tRNA pseudouridine38-40 synthase